MALYQQSISKLEVDIKNYDRIKRINKGGFSTLYAIKDKKSGETYAAKIIDCGDDHEECDRIIDLEVGILLSSKHPTIINFIGYSKIDFLEENNVIIIMELATNGSLSDILKQIQKNNGPKYYNNTTRQIILAGISRGMKYLHDRNIIHRDLKPGNILLDANYLPHISDFGLSKAFKLGHSYSQSQVVGTLPYMAPELFRDKKYDRKADVYSFGILMYEVVTDLPAYPDLENNKITDHEFRCRVMNDNYRPVFKYPVKKSIRTLIEKCWSNNPSDRPNFGEIFNNLANLNEEVSSNKDENFILEDVEMDEFNIYIDEINKIRDHTDHLLNQICELKKENKQLKTENERKDDEIEQLKTENERKDDEIEQLKTENERKDDEIEQLEIKIKQLKETIIQIKQAEEEKNIEIQQLKQNEEQIKNISVLNPLMHKESKQESSELYSSMIDVKHKKNFKLFKPKKIQIKNEETPKTPNDSQTENPKSMNKEVKPIKYLQLNFEYNDKKFEFLHPPDKDKDIKSFESKIRRLFKIDSQIDFFKKNSSNKNINDLKLSDINEPLTEIDVCPTGTPLDKSIYYNIYGKPEEYKLNGVKNVGELKNRISEDHDYLMRKKISIVFGGKILEDDTNINRLYSTEDSKIILTAYNNKSIIDFSCSVNLDKI